DLPVRVLQEFFLMEGGGGDVASLEQNPLAVSPGVVARLAIDRVALFAALENGVVHRHRVRCDKLTVRSLAREERRVLFQPVECDRSGNGLAHRGTVVEERAGRLGAGLRLVVHARIEMDRRGGPRAAGGGGGEEKKKKKKAA